jgi:hypothetical protein
MEWSWTPLKTFAQTRPVMYGAPTAAVLGVVLGLVFRVGPQLAERSTMEPFSQRVGRGYGQPDLLALRQGSGLCDRHRLPGRHAPPAPIVADTGYYEPVSYREPAPAPVAEPPPVVIAANAAREESALGLDPGRHSRPATARGPGSAGAAAQLITRTWSRLASPRLAFPLRYEYWSGMTDYTPQQIVARGARADAEAAADAIDFDVALEGATYSILEEDEDKNIWRIDAFPTTTRTSPTASTACWPASVKVTTEVLADADWLAMALSGLPPVGRPLLRLRHARPRPPAGQHRQPAHRGRRGLRHRPPRHDRRLPAGL